jgi:Mn2+/Fe2+ NRAMP family transporter
LEDTVVPHIEFNRTYIAFFVAVLGTTISPYLFFWQSADRLEEMRLEPEGGHSAEPLGMRSASSAAKKQR